MTAKATRSKATPQAVPTIESLRRYTPEQVVEMGLTTYTVATLKKLAQRHQIRHHREGAVATGRIYFTLADLQANTAAEEFTPLASA
ncbi:hypothetical protein [Streptomyces sp. NPDC021224]|uniref:hypothetical protein n=1 Tax=unclassified Streptomyces TaxID=2593676 RepID=UPI0037B0C1A5